MNRRLRRKTGKAASSGPGGGLARAEAAMLKGDFDTAAKLLRRAVKADAGNFAAWANLGAVEAEREDTQAAQAAFRRALALQPASVPVLSNLAALANQTGQREEALELYRRTLALAPADAELWHDLARIKRFETGDPDVAALEKLAADPSLDDEAAMFAAFALGKAYEDIGDFARAFAETARANGLKWRRQHFDLEAENRLAARIIETFPASYFTDRFGAGSVSDVPIFVLGMPRSGTTLVEQILASHSQVFGGGEREDLKAVVGAAVRPFPDAAAGLASDDLRALGDGYVRRLRKLDADARRITDKMPRNFYFIGLIGAALPNARIIHCRRSPLDTCLSCFQQHFPYGQEFSFDLATLGGYYRIYRRLMDHWRQVLPGRILDVDYEQVVSDPETQARRIVDHVGLPWEDQCLDFHESKRQVATASAAQVREPVHRRSVARWRRYERELAPLIDALGAYADTRDDV